MIDPSATRVARTLTSEQQLACCRYSPDRKYLFAAGYDGRLYRWTLADGTRTAVPAHRGWVESMAVHPDGTALFTADSWGRVRCWRVGGGAIEPKWAVADAHSQWLRRLVLSPDGKLVATCGNDRAVRLFGAADGRPVRALSGHAAHVQSVAFGGDGGTLASGDLRGVVKLWDVATGRCVRDLDASVLYKRYHQYDQGGVRAMAFDARTGTLYCGGFVGSNANQAHGVPTVVAFDPATGRQVGRMRPKADFQGPVVDVAFHPAGYLIGAGSSEGGGALWFWKPGEGEEAHQVRYPFSFRGLGLHPDGASLAAAAFGDAGGQRGGNGRRLDARGEYPDFQGTVVLYALGGEAAAPKP